MPRDRARWRVGFYVEVEVEAYEGEAVLMAEAATHWPGDWQPPHPPTVTSGRLGGRRVEAQILRSQALMVKEVG
jgi:hypothetical protein